MLYLMMNKTDTQHLIKVGFSDGPHNLATRRKSYYSYNPLAIMRSTCAGSREMELKCREKITEWGGSRIKGTEWFLVSKNLFDILYKNGMGAFYPDKTPIHFLEKYEFCPF